MSTQKGNFSSIINGDKPVLVDFHADWCAPCKMLSPTVKEVAKKLDNSTRVIKIDVDKNQMIAHKFQVASIPTLILFKKGEVVWRNSGVLSKHELLTQVQKYI